MRSNGIDSSDILEVEEGASCDKHIGMSKRMDFGNYPLILKEYTLIVLESNYSTLKRVVLYDASLFTLGI